MTCLYAIVIVIVIVRKGTGIDDMPLCNWKKNFRQVKSCRIFFQCSTVAAPKSINTEHLHWPHCDYHSKKDILRRGYALSSPQLLINLFVA